MFLVARLGALANPIGLRIPMFLVAKLGALTNPIGLGIPMLPSVEILLLCFGITPLWLQAPFNLISASVHHVPHKIRGIKIFNIA